MRALAALLATLAVSVPLAAQSGSRLWRPDERAVISDFGYVEAIGLSRDVLYVVTRGGIGVYDRRFWRWEPPVTPVSGLPTETVLAALVDPVDRSLWMGTVSGLLRYDPALESFETLIVPGGVSDLMFDRDDPFGGLYLRGRQGWQLLPRGSQLPVPFAAVPPPSRQLRAESVERILQRLPNVAARAPLLLTDQRLRRYRFTAGAEAPDNEDVYLGTDGGGVLKIDIMTNVEPMPFGLLAPSAGAVVAVREGVWVGTGRPSARTGFSFVSTDLQRYAYEEGPPATGYRFRSVYDLVGNERTLWAATDVGVWKVEVGRRAQRSAIGVIAETESAYAIAEAPAGVWVGTERGLVLIDDSGDARRVDDRVNTQIFALAASHDTVWVGGALGLGVTWWDADEIVVPAEVATEPLLREPVFALVFGRDTLVAAYRDRIARRAPDGRWLVERVISGELGSVTSLAADDAGVWIGGLRGIGFYRFATRAFAFFATVGDVPGPVRDLAVDREHLWVASDGGLVRFAKEALLR